MVQYPVPGTAWEVVNIELLQLPQSQYGSRYLLASVDPFDSVIAPIKDKTAAHVAHALVNHVMCPHSSIPIILRNNGTEFGNAILNELCTQFRMRHSFITTYHPAAHRLVEGAHQKILQVLRPIVYALSITGKIGYHK